MIHFEVLQSPDGNVLTSFRYFQNMLYLGRKTGDLVIEDAQLRDSHLLIEVVEDKLLVHPQRDVGFYLLNDKRATTIRKLKVGDRLGLGKTVIKILGFEDTPKESKAELLGRKVDALLAENSPRLPLIEKLTKLMK